MLRRAVASAALPGSRSWRHLLLRPPSVLVRRLCSDKKPPRAFDSFFPRAKKPSSGSAEKAEGEAAGGAARARDAKSNAKLDSSAEAEGAEGSTSFGGGSGGGGANRQLAVLAASGAMAAFVLYQNVTAEASSARPSQEISMQHFLSNVLASGRVQKLVVLNSTLVRVYCAEGGVDGGADGAEADGGAAWNGGTLSQSHTFHFSIGSSEQFEEKLDAAQATRGVPLRAHVPVQYQSRTSWMSEASRFLPTLLLVGFFYMLTRGVGAQMGGGQGGLFNVGKSKAVKATKVKTRFNDVAGLHEAKVEIMEFVDILQNPERYTRLGAKIPKGALLVGPPGCGKTLLAKATAGEAKAPFYSISGSDFIEMFVGVGPSRVRDLFAQARPKHPNPPSSP